MKKIVPILIFILLCKNSKADCLGVSTYCSWPIGNTINKSPLIIFDTGDTGLVKKVTGDYSVFLISVKTNKKIKLNVTGVNKNGLNMIQVFFNVGSELTEGDSYKLVHFFKGKKTSLLTKEDQYSQKAINYIWAVDKSINQALPKWVDCPKVVNKIYRLFGCGPEKELFFKLNFSSASKVISKAVITSLTSGKQYVCYIHENYGLLQLGHGMCSGEFDFADGGEFEVTFYLLNEGGLLSAPCPAIRFSEPTPKDQY